MDTFGILRKGSNHNMSSVEKGDYQILEGSKAMRPPRLGAAISEWTFLETQKMMLHWIF